MATERTVGVQSDTRESFYGIAPVLRRKSRKDACSAGYTSLRADSLLGDKMGVERGKEGVLPPSKFSAYLTHEQRARSQARTS